MQSANERLKEIEQHYGGEIENKRLRFHILEELKRERAKYERLKSAVKSLSLIDNPGVYDIKTHKLSQWPKRKENVIFVDAVGDEHPSDPNEY